jgi:hypothetical protein
VISFLGAFPRLHFLDTNTMTTINAMIPSTTPMKIAIEAGFVMFSCIISGIYGRGAGG